MYYVTWEPIRRKQIPEEAIKSEYFYTRFDEQWENMTNGCELREE